MPILLISESTFTFTLFKQKTHRCSPHESLLGVAGVAGVAELQTFYIYIYVSPRVTGKGSLKRKKRQEIEVWQRCGRGVAEVWQDN